MHSLKKKETLPTIILNSYQPLGCKFLSRNNYKLLLHHLLNFIKEHKGTTEQDGRLLQIAYLQAYRHDN